MPFVSSNALDEPLLFERIETFKGGMNAFLRPTLLDPDQCALLQNMLLTDNHLASTRFGIAALGGAVVNAQTLIQGLVYFDTPALELLVAAHNQKFWQWDNAAWTEITGFTPADASSRVEMVQLLDKIFISDGNQNVRSWDGTTFTDLGNAQGVGGSPPVGCTILTALTNRLFASGVAATPDTIWVSDILDAGNGAWNWVQWSFRVGAGDGEAIVALVPIQDRFMAVVKQNSIYVVDCDTTATSAVQWSIQLITKGSGCLARRSAIQFGNDVYFLGNDGIRAVQRMNTDTVQFEVAPPLSEPLQPYIERINWPYAFKACAFKYNQYAFFALPLDDATEPSHTLVWNGRTESWMGVWTGWTPTQFALTRFSDNPRVVFGDTVGFVNEWLDHADPGLDSTYQDRGADFDTLIRTRSFVFQDPVSEKDPEYLEIRFVESVDAATVTVYVDDAAAPPITMQMDQTTNQLPVDLPFDLASAKPTTRRSRITAFGTFNEVYVEIETAGKLVVKNLTMAAFLNAVQDDET